MHPLIIAINKLERPKRVLAMRLLSVKGISILETSIALRRAEYHFKRGYRNEHIFNSHFKAVSNYLVIPRKYRKFHRKLRKEWEKKNKRENPTWDELAIFLASKAKKEFRRNKKLIV